MIIRGLDANHDWLFGKGINDYNSGLAALAENIQTRLLSFLGDCFFAQNDGIDWFNLLGGKNIVAVQLAVSAIILNTEDVTGLQNVVVTLNANRLLTIKYNVQSSLGNLQSSFQYDLT